MAVNGYEQKGSNGTLASSMWDVNVHFGVSECLRQTEIDNVYNVSMIVEANKHVAWFDISMNDILRVKVLQPLDL